MELVDTHCHIHEAQFELAGDDPVRARWLRAGKGDPDQIIADARADGVSQLICVGTDADDSEIAVGFVQSRENTWASIGIHPHEAKRYAHDPPALRRFAELAKRPKAQSKIIAVGECGLDYYYNHSPKREQEQLLRFQMELALEHNLPMIFHVRDAFEDFWPIFDSYLSESALKKIREEDSEGTSEGADIRGVVHSFSAGRKELDEILARGLYVGLNGIVTFTKEPEQLVAARAVPRDKLLLETDAPFLTPAPYRGKICEPKHTRVTLEFLAALRNEGVQILAAATTANARHLFSLHG